MPKLLVHICCAPCLLAPLTVLKKEQTSFDGVFVNFNIHPYNEYSKRSRAVEVLADREKGQFEISFKSGYGLESFLSSVMANGRVVPKNERCKKCWEFRLRETARFAKESGYDAFSTSLLASPMQDHERIREIGEAVADEEKINFYYRDFRPAYEEAQVLAKKMSLYRQQYCGCIFSEQERFEKK